MVRKMQPCFTKSLMGIKPVTLPGMTKQDLQGLTQKSLMPLPRSTLLARSCRHIYREWLQLPLDIRDSYGVSTVFSWVLTNNHCSFFLGVNKRRLVLPLFSVGLWVFITGKGPSEKNLEKENLFASLFWGNKKLYTNLKKKNYTHGFSPLTHTPLCVQVIAPWRTGSCRICLEGFLRHVKQWMRWSKEFQGNFWGFLHWNLFETYHWTAWRERFSKPHLSHAIKTNVGRWWVSRVTCPKVIVITIKMAKAKVLAVLTVKTIKSSRLLCK